MTWQDQIDNHLVHSTVASTYGNGTDQLKSNLSPIHDPRDPDRTVGFLVPSAATSWEAMATHALRDGIVLLPTSSADTFRSLTIQQNIFTDRYRTTDQGNGSRVCAGKRWYLRKGKATAACPGTSNHGKGEAVDVADCSGDRLKWLENHARSYGWAWELASEPWHIHYLLGDALPPGLKAEPVFEEDDMAIVLTTEGALLLHAGKLVYISEVEGIDSDSQKINQWDLRKAPKTWAAVKAAYGPVVRA